MIGNCCRPDPRVLQILSEEQPEFFKIPGGTKDFDKTAWRLISVGAESRNWLDKYVARHERLARLFQLVKRVAPDHVSRQTDPRQERDSRKNTKFCGARLRKLESRVVTMGLCLVQVLPALALVLVSSKAARLGIAIVLIVCVSALNAIFSNTMRAKNFEAIAAYVSKLQSKRFLSYWHVIASRSWWYSSLLGAFKLSILEHHLIWEFYNFTV